MSEVDTAFAVEAAGRASMLLASILDAMPPDTPKADALAATLLAYVVMALESGLTLEEAVSALQTHWKDGVSLRSEIMGGPR